MEYIQAKGVSRYWLKACRNGLENFRRFLRLERGLGEDSKITPFDVSAHTQGLPALAGERTGTLSAASSKGTGAPPAST